jgi:uncharacterized protein YqkB
VLSHKVETTLEIEPLKSDVKVEFLIQNSVLVELEKCHIYDKALYLLEDATQRGKLDSLVTNIAIKDGKKVSFEFDSSSIEQTESTYELKLQTSANCYGQKMQISVFLEVKTNAIVEYMNELLKEDALEESN